MIKEENSKLHYSLEELFILQNIDNVKVIRYKVFTLDFGFQMSRDVTKPGRFIFLNSRICAFIYSHIRLGYRAGWGGGLGRGIWGSVSTSEKFLATPLHCVNYFEILKCC